MSCHVLSWCLFVRKGSGVLRSLLPASLFREPIDGPSVLPTDSSDHTTLRAPFSHAHIGPIATACVSSPRDWAVSTSSHMQQGIIIFFGASTARLRDPFVRTAHRRYLDQSSECASTRVWRPARFQQSTIIPVTMKTVTDTRNSIKQNNYSGLVEYMSLGLS